MTDTTKNEPIAILRAKGTGLKVNIWANEGKSGTFYSATLHRTVKNEETGVYTDYSSFSGTDLLAAAYLLNQAYGRIQEHTNGASA